MASKVRVLPALIAVAIGALAFKGVDLAQAVAEAADKEEHAPAPETELTAGVGDHEEHDGAAPAEGEAAPPAGSEASADSCKPSLAADEMGLSSQEVLVLRSLQARRETLDQRESGVETREQMAAAAEARLNEQITGLKTLQGEVEKLLGQMNAKGDENMAKLVKTYEGMKASQAAAIFNTMDDKVLLDIAKTMKPATLGPILAVMDVKRAESLTRALAALTTPPANIEALQKTAG